MVIIQTSSDVVYKSNNNYHLMFLPSNSLRQPLFVVVLTHDQRDDTVALVLPRPHLSVVTIEQVYRVEQGHDSTDVVHQHLDERDRATDKVNYCT